MKIPWIAAALLLTASAVRGEEFTDDIWFCADFDRSMRMDGRIVSHSVPDDAIVDGKFGKACFFRRRAVNSLPPMRDFVSSTNNFDALGGSSPVGNADAGTLSYQGGEFLVKPRWSGVPNHWVECAGHSVFAFEVKGGKGTELTLTPECPPLSEKQVEEIRKHDKSFDPEKACKDEGSPRTFILNGDWQRVDNNLRLCFKLRSRKVGWRIRTTGPVVMRRFLQQGAGVYPYQRISQPTEWLDGGETREEYPVIVTDSERIAGFPVSNGTFSCWLKTPENWVPPTRGISLFTCGYRWDRTWNFTGGSAAPLFPIGLSKKWQMRTNTWQHVAVTWSPEEASFYVNGECVESRKAPRFLRLDEPGAKFKLGGDNDSADIMVDDLVILRRALSAEEISGIYKSDSGILEGKGGIIAADPDFVSFLREDDASHLSFEIDSPYAGKLEFSLNVGGLDFPAKLLSVPTGRSTVSLPFRPSDLRAGEHEWSVAVKNSEGKRLLTHSGRLNILSGFSRNDFRLQTWGFDSWAIPFYRKAGINSVIVWDTDIENARKAVDGGFHLVLRVEDWKLWPSMDEKRIRDTVSKRLAPYRGIAQWDSTLLNSETYSVGHAKHAAANSRWLEWATTELGFSPKVGFTEAPCGVNWSAFGMKGPSGIMERNEPYETLDWYMRRGMQHYFVNRINMSVVHEYSPGNTVWSEPSPSPEDLDMTADWIYNYDTSDCLYLLRRQASVPRAAGKRYMPTLAMGYWSPDFPLITCEHPAQKEPATGKGVKCTMSQTADELAIKSWMCLGGAAADSISYFSTEWCWLQAKTNGILLEAGLPLQKCPGWQKIYLAEKDCDERFGTFVRDSFRPAAMLLKNMPNDRAPVALLLAKEIDYSGEFWWPRVNYSKVLGAALARLPVPYDVITADEEYTSDILGKYSYVVYPMLNCITPAHDKVIRSLPESTTLLTDNTYKPKTQEFTYPSIKKINGLSNIYPWTNEKVGRPVADYFAPVADEMRSRVAAWSEEDGTNSWTFAKTYAGVHYITVVNNARRSGGCPQTSVYTNETYRPMGAAQRITTHFNVPGIVYTFNSAEKPATASEIVRDFAAAEGRVYCVYPKPLTAPRLELKGRPMPGGEAELRIRICDNEGSPAPGRLVVRLELRDPDGRLADESGLYTVEGGEAMIKLRFSRLDKPGAFFSKKWTARITDLTSGLESSVSFRLRQ